MRQWWRNLTLTRRLLVTGLGVVALAVVTVAAWAAVRPDLPTCPPGMIDNIGENCEYRWMEPTLILGAGGKLLAGLAFLTLHHVLAHSRHGGAGPTTAGRVPWSGGIEGVVVNLSDAAGAGR
jgi:hypothetical protein